MSSYILVGGECDDKRWWNDLVRTCAVIGDTFEIHCWSDEKAEIQAALKYGHRVSSNWSGGTVIRGRITKESLTFLMETKKPTDTQIYNKMTPFFTIVFEYGLRSSDGTEYYHANEGGCGNGQFQNIPAGSYRLFVRNTDYSGVPAYENPDLFPYTSFNATGAMNYKLD